MARDLTAKQRAFVEAYLRNGRNAAEAYRTAYDTNMSARLVADEASKLLQHPGIAPIVAEAERRAAAATERALDRYAVTKERIVSALARLGFYDARDVFSWSEDGIRSSSRRTRSAPMPRRLPSPRSARP
jgi:phage terminase small subunit